MHSHGQFLFLDGDCYICRLLDEVDSDDDDDDGGDY